MFAIDTRARKHRAMAPMAILIGAVGTLACLGCSVQHYDPATGIEHVWGIGHVRMRVNPPAEAVRSVMTGSETIGFGVAVGGERASLVAGWNREQRLSVLNDNTSVRLEWPTSDFFSVRVGSQPPALTTRRAEQ